MTEKIFVYIRNSTEKQAEKQTQDNQKFSIDQFLQGKDVEIVANFEDIAKSGSDKNREQFLLMKSRLNEVDAIAVFDIDRLSRDLEIGLDLMQILMRLNIKIYEARTQSIKDLTQDNDQLLYLIGTWYSSLERKKIHARQKVGIERYTRKNGRWGRKKTWGKDISGKKFSESGFIVEYKRLSGFKLSKLAIARMLSLNIHTLYDRLYETKLMIKGA